MTLFVDSSGILALVDRDDPAHNGIVEAFALGSWFVTAVSFDGAVLPGTADIARPDENRPNGPCDRTNASIRLVGVATLTRGVEGFDQEQEGLARIADALAARPPSPSRPGDHGTRIADPADPLTERLPAHRRSISLRPAVPSRRTSPSENSV